MENTLRSRKEELEASTTHGIGFILSIIATYILFKKMSDYNSDPIFITACQIYATSLILVYGTSTLSHMYTFQKINTWLRKCDQAFIYFLIVGTATPFIALLLVSTSAHKTSMGLYILALLWTLASIGCLAKIILAHGTNNIGVWLCVLLGWGEAIAMGLIWKEIDAPSLYWLTAGGLFYTIGVLFLVWDLRKYHFHTIWHMFVIGGSISHFISIMSLI